MGLRLLGPVDLTVNRRSVDLGGPRQRAVLAMLGLHANRIVPVDRLIDAVWETAPPSTARGQIQTCICALRRLLAEAGHPDAILTRPPGYVLRLAPADLDTLRFAALVDAARVQAESGRTGEAAVTLRDALALWRGVAVSGVTGELVERGAAVLEDRRMAAVEELARLDLALGRHEELVHELRALVAEHPLRERLHGFLMLALYRAGRQAEALEAARRARKMLVEEIGIEPGRELQDLAGAILRADPELDLVPPQPSRPVAPGRTGEPAASPAVPDPGPAPAAGPAAGLVAEAALPADRASVPVPAPEQPLPPPVLPEQNPVPQQLPASISDFTGREDALEEIRNLLTGDREAGGTRWSMPIVAISGKGGVGKSSLAVRAAHELGSRFPDGRLYADLRTLGDGDPVAQLLARFLRALGVAGSAVPDDLSERAELYRSRLSGKRVLLVLDDVAGEEQVLPLLPGSPSCAVVTTSRRRLAGLPGAHRIDVDVFGPDQSLDLLGRVAGQDRVANERAAAVELVAFCGGLPLALRIAGARLASRPHWRIDGLVRRLRDDANRLDELAHYGMELRSNIELTYRALGERARRLFRLFALVQAPDFNNWTAAALLDTSLAEGSEELETLVDAQLLDPVQYHDARAVRYRFHDLIRIYARERLFAEEGEQEREAALGRVLGSLLAQAEDAHRAEYGGDYTILHGAAPRWRPVDDGGGPGREAAQWWEAERRTLVAAVQQSARAGLDELCWDLALTSVTLFEAKGYFDDWRDCTRLALEAAEHAGNSTGAAAMLYSMGTLHMFQTRLEEAQRCFTTALEIFHDHGEAHGCALVLRNLAHVNGLRGDVPAMLNRYHRALRTMRSVGDRVGEAHILRSLAKYELDEGRTDHAQELLERALGICREVGCLRAEAQVVHRFAEVHLAAGRTGLAQQSLLRVLRIVRDTGDRIGEVYAVYGLGMLRRQEDRLDTAETALVHALSLSRQVGEQLIEAKSLYALGEIAVVRGTATTGVRHLRAASELFEQLGSALWRARALVLLARAQRAGDPAAAGRCLDRAERLLKTVESRESAQVRADLAAVRAELPSADLTGAAAELHGPAPA